MEALRRRSFRSANPYRSYYMYQRCHTDTRLIPYQWGTEILQASSPSVNPTNASHEKNKGFYTADTTPGPCFYSGKRHTGPKKSRIIKHPNPSTLGRRTTASCATDNTSPNDVFNATTNKEVATTVTKPIAHPRCSIIHLKDGAGVYTTEETKVAPQQVPDTSSAEVVTCEKKYGRKDDLPNGLYDPTRVPWGTDSMNYPAIPIDESKLKHICVNHHKMGHLLYKEELKAMNRASIWQNTKETPDAALHAAEHVHKFYGESERTTSCRRYSNRALCCSPHGMQSIHYSAPPWCQNPPDWEKWRNDLRKVANSKSKALYLIRQFNRQRGVADTPGNAIRDTKEIKASYYQNADYAKTTSDAPVQIRDKSSHTLCPPPPQGGVDRNSVSSGTIGQNNEDCGENPGILKLKLQNYYVLYKREEANKEALEKELIELKKECDRLRIYEKRSSTDRNFSKKKSGVKQETASPENLASDDSGEILNPRRMNQLIVCLVHMGGSLLALMDSVTEDENVNSLLGSVLEYLSIVRHLHTDIERLYKSIYARVNKGRQLQQARGNLYTVARRSNIDPGAGGTRVTHRLYNYHTASRKRPYCPLSLRQLAKGTPLAEALQPENGLRKSYNEVNLDPERDNPYNDTILTRIKPEIDVATTDAPRKPMELESRCSSASISTLDRRLRLSIPSGRYSVLSDQASFNPLYGTRTSFYIEDKENSYIDKFINQDSVTENMDYYKGNSARFRTIPLHAREAREHRKSYSSLSGEMSERSGIISDGLSEQGARSVSHTKEGTHPKAIGVARNRHSNKEAMSIGQIGKSIKDAGEVDLRLQKDTCALQRKSDFINDFEAPNKATSAKMFSFMPKEKDIQKDVKVLAQADNTISKFTGNFYDLEMQPGPAYPDLLQRCKIFISDKCNKLIVNSDGGARYIDTDKIFPEFPEFCPEKSKYQMKLYIQELPKGHSPWTLLCDKEDNLLSFYTRVPKQNQLG